MHAGCKVLKPGQHSFRGHSCLWDLGACFPCLGVGSLGALSHQKRFPYGWEQRSWVWDSLVPWAARWHHEPFLLGRSILLLHPAALYGGGVKAANGAQL